MAAVRLARHSAPRPEIPSDQLGVSRTRNGAREVVACRPSYATA